MGILFLLLVVSAVWSHKVAKYTKNRFISKLDIFTYVYVISIIIYSILTISPFYGTIADIIYSVLFVSVILSGILIFAEFIYAIVKRKKSEALKILCIGLIMLACSLALSFLLIFVGGANDHFGRRHPIPSEMVYEEPADDTEYKQYAPDSITVDDFTIFDGIQPGIYLYSFQLKEAREGTVYLKCFEATKGMPLSESTIEKATSIPVSYNDNRRIFKQKRDFTIYEGSWGEPYAVRFELWFKPSDSDTSEMITSKIYKIEGWTR